MPIAIVVGDPALLLAAFATLAHLPWPARALAGAAALIPIAFAAVARQCEHAWLAAHGERLADVERRRLRAAAAESAGSPAAGKS